MELVHRPATELAGLIASGELSARLPSERTVAAAPPAPRRGLRETAAQRPRPERRLGWEWSTG